MQAAPPAVEGTASLDPLDRTMRAFTAKTRRHEGLTCQACFLALSAALFGDAPGPRAAAVFFACWPSVPHTHQSSVRR